MRVRKIPMRKCIACQEMKPKKSLIRIVRTPEHEILVDLTGKKSGRGAYLCASVKCFQSAQKRRSLEKALKVKVSDEVYAQMEEVIGRVESDG